MASWTAGCTGQTNEELVCNLQQAGIISEQKVIDSMLKTDRGKLNCHYVLISL